MKQQNVFGKPNDHSTPPERQARIHRHGSLIFLGQILVLGSVPIFDLGQDRTPTLFVMFSLSVSIATVWSLGYQRLTHLLASLSLIACLWIFIAQVEVNLGMRTVPLLICLFVQRILRFDSLDTVKRLTKQSLSTSVTLGCFT